MSRLGTPAGPLTILQGKRGLLQRFGEHFIAEKLTDQAHPMHRWEPTCPDTEPLGAT
jgi:hypothetical protein